MPNILPDHVLNHDLAMRRFFGLIGPEHPAYRAAVETLNHCSTMPGVVAYARRLAGYLQFLKAERIDPRAADGAVLQRWFRSRSHLRPATCRSELAVVRTFYRELATLGLVRIDPTYGLKVKGGPAAYRRAMTLDEGRALLASVRADFADPRTALIARRDNVIITLGLLMGPRSAEMRRLTYADISLDDNAEITFLRKGHKEDCLPLAPAARSAIVEMRNALAEVGVVVRPTDAVITMVDKRTISWAQKRQRQPLPAVGPSTIYRTVVTRLARAKINPPRKGSHQLRKTCATLAWLGGAKPESVQLLLAHSNLRTTMDHYIAPAQGRLAPAWESIDLS